MRFSAGVALVLTAGCLLSAQNANRAAVAHKGEPAPDPPPKPVSDKLTYDVEWRLIHAGTVVIEAQKNHADMHLDSAGIVSSLFKVHDVYSVDYDEGLCAASAMEDSQEGKRHHETKVTYDR